MVKYFPRMSDGRELRFSQPHFYLNDVVDGGMLLRSLDLAEITGMIEIFLL